MPTPYDVYRPQSHIIEFVSQIQMDTDQIK
jgi:hypothetical protein